MVLDLSRIDTVVFDKTGTLTTTASLAVGRRRGGSTRRSGRSCGGWRPSRRIRSASPSPGRTSRRSGLPRIGTPTRRVAGLAGRSRSARFRARDSPGSSTVSRSRSARRRSWRASRGSRSGRRTARSWRSAARRLGARDGDAASGRRCGRADAAARHDAGCCLGDTRRAKRAMVARSSARRCTFRQTPEDKLALVERERRAGRRVLMVGDGLNDAGALAPPTSASPSATTRRASSRPATA